MQAGTENNERMPNDIVKRQTTMSMDECPHRIRRAPGEQQKEHGAWQVIGDATTHRQQHPAHDEIKRKQQPLEPTRKCKRQRDTDRGQ